MLSAVVLSPTSFVAPASVAPTTVRSNAPLMSEATSRRDLFARAAAGALGVSAVQSASAKAGQFSKISVFDLVGEASISSPYQNGGPKGSDIQTLEKGTTTYGYAKSDGPILANGFRSDVEREKAAYAISSRIVKSQGPNIDTKTWWLVRDNLRGQAYNMKANMLAINNVSANKAAADKAYKKFWTEINQLDLACTKKEYDLAKKEYADVLAALDAYEATIA